jgi:Co/Zn/Cd efflux system component
MSAHCCHDHHCTEPRTLNSPSWRRALWIALLVNAGMFLAEIIAGVAAGSASPNSAKGLAASCDL